MLLLLLLFLLPFCYGVIERSSCDKWYTLYGCENKMVLIKNIYMYDKSSYLSTQLLTHNPEKKITCLLDFGLPEYIKNEIINSIKQDEDYNLPLELYDTIHIEKLKYLSKYMDSFMVNNIPLYISKYAYDKFGLQQGIYDSYIEHGIKLQASTKGKPFNFQINIVSDKSSISNVWSKSLHSDKYDAVLNIGKNSNVWSKYNYLYIDINKMILSDTEIPKPFYFNENKVKIKCFSNERILNTLLFEQHSNNNNETLLNLLVDSKCVSLNTVILKKSHIREYFFKNEYYNLIIDPNSRFNYLPPKLYFILYEKLSDTSSINTKKVKKKDAYNNFIDIGFINSNDVLKFTSTGVFDFTFDINNDNNIVLGADIFTYFSHMKYDHINAEYTFWINDITSNNNFGLILINVIFIFEIILFFRWYLTSNMAISNYIIFNILTNRDTFYYNNSQLFAEILAILLSGSILGLTIYTFINTSNLQIYLIVSFSFQCFLIVFLCIITLVFVIQSRDKLKTILFKDNGDISPPTQEKRPKDWTILSLAGNTPYLPVFVPKKKGKDDEEEYDYDDVTDKMRKHIEKTQVSVDKAVFRLYALTTTKVLNQNILVCVGRNLIHMSLILLTMITGLTVLIDDRLTKAILTLLSMLIVYYFNYYILLLLYIMIHFYTKIKNKVLWLSFIIISVLFLFILTPYIAFTFVFNFLDSTNANHSTFVVALSSVVLVLITTVVPSKAILNNIERWKGILQNKIKLKIQGIEISKEV